MPRIREDVTPEVPELSDDDVAVETASAEGAPPKATRSPRRPAPEGVALGMLDAPVAVEAPPSGATAGRRGKPVGQKTLGIIKACQDSPGTWFLIGEFLSPQNPTKDSALGKAGLEFSNERVDHEGSVTFKRYAMLPVATEG